MYCVLIFIGNFKSCKMFSVYATYTQFILYKTNCFKNFNANRTCRCLILFLLWNNFLLSNAIFYFGNNLPWSTFCSDKRRDHTQTPPHMLRKKQQPHVKLFTPIDVWFYVRQSVVDDYNFLPEKGFHQGT